MHNRTRNPSKENLPSYSEHEQRSKTDQFASEQKPLPENISEYIQKARDELKEYEERKKFYETRRKKEIILDLALFLKSISIPRICFALYSLVSWEIILAQDILKRFLQKNIQKK